MGRRPHASLHLRLNHLGRLPSRVFPLLPANQSLKIRRQLSALETQILNLHLRIMLRKCPACGTQNRVPASHLSDTGRCGSCKAPLPPLSIPIEATAEVFREVIQNAKVPVLVDFWANWCGPCKMAAPEVAALAGELAGRLIVLKVDTEREQAIAAQFRIQSIPNFIVFQNAQPALQRSGAMPRAELRRWVESLP